MLMKERYQFIAENSIYSFSPQSLISIHYIVF